MAVAMPKNSGSGMPVAQKPRVANTPCAAPVAAVPSSVARPTRRNSASKSRVYSRRSGDSTSSFATIWSQWRNTTCRVRSAKKRASRLLAVTEASAAATAAERDAISVSAPLSRSLRLSGEKPNRPSQPVAVCIHPLAAPPGPSEATSVAVRAAPRLTKSEMKPTTAPTMRCPAASTITTEASTGLGKTRRSAS